MSNVIQIGDFSIAKESRWQYRPDKCRHTRLTLEGEGEIVRCRDCKSQVSAWWALGMLTEHINHELTVLHAERDRFAEEKRKGVTLLAARAVEHAWRSRKMVPCCPHCHEAIFPDDGFGRSMTNKQIAIARRAAKGNP